MEKNSKYHKKMAAMRDRTSGRNRTTRRVSWIDVWQLTSRHCSVGPDFHGHILAWGVKRGNNITNRLSVEASCIQHFILQKLLEKHYWQFFFFFFFFFFGQEIRKKIKIRLWPEQVRWIHDWHYWLGSEQGCFQSRALSITHNALEGSGLGPATFTP